MAAPRSRTVHLAGLEWPSPGSSGVAATVSAAGTAPLGEILRRARTHRRLSLRDVEERTGVPNAHLSQIERGVIRRPNPSLLMTLCDFYDLNYELLTRWAGYLDELPAGAGEGMLETAMRAFARLDLAAQSEVLRQIDELESRSRRAE